MKFYKGQKIICLSNESKSYLPIEPGKVYTVRKIYTCPCGSKQLILNESYYNLIMICKCGRREYRLRSYFEWRFRPLIIS